MKISSKSSSVTFATTACFSSFLLSFDGDNPERQRLAKAYAPMRHRTGIYARTCTCTYVPRMHIHECVYLHARGRGPAQTRAHASSNRTHPQHMRVAHACNAGSACGGCTLVGGIGESLTRSPQPQSFLQLVLRQHCAHARAQAHVHVPREVRAACVCTTAASNMSAVVVVAVAAAAAAVKVIIVVIVIVVAFAVTIAVVVVMVIAVVGAGIVFANLLLLFWLSVAI